MNRINWGIIGLGNIAQRFSEAFQEISNAKLLAIASKDMDKLNKFERKFLIEKKFVFQNYEDLIFCKDVDIIYIALPNSLHHFWIIQSIKNKKNVLVEKPATTSFSEILDINNTLLNTNLFFGEAYMYRHLPQIKNLMKIIKNKELGNLISMESSFGTNLLTKKKLIFFRKKKKIDFKNRLFNKNLGGGCILDLGCYTTSFSLLICSLFDEINTKNIKIKNINREIGDSGVDIHSNAELGFINGFKSKINASFKENLGRKSVINGERGSLLLDDTWFGKKNIIKMNGQNKKEISFKSYKNVYSHQIEDISKNLINGIKDPTFPVCGINESILNSKILHGWLHE